MGKNLKCSGSISGLSLCGLITHHGDQALTLQRQEEEDEQF